MAAAADLQALVQRLQKLSEDQFKEEDTNVFLVTCQLCLEEEQLEVLFEIIKDEKNLVLIGHMGWNLIGPITQCILRFRLGSQRENVCVEMLLALVPLCNPKEFLLGILEQIDEAAGEHICRTILPFLRPLQKVLLKHGNRRYYAVGLSLATIHSQLSALPVPYTPIQMREDKHLLCQCFLSLIPFIQPFIDMVTQSKNISRDPEIQQLRKELLTFCFRCLKFPLLNAQLYALPENEDDNVYRTFAREMIEFLVTLGESLPKTFVQRGYSDETIDADGSVPDQGIYSAEGLASFSYLLFVQHIGIDSFPFVFGPSFLLKSNLVHISVLIKRTEESILSKGLDLLENSLLRVDNDSLPEDVLDVIAANKVLQDLVKVMTLCPIEDLRKKSLVLLQSVINKFCVEGRYKLFRCLLKVSGHAGVESFVIHNIKNQIDAALKMNQEKKNIFLGVRLIPLLHSALSLPEGAETDLLQSSDRIMASLNLLRYLVIKDENNETGVWSELDKIEQNFIKPLHTGLNMSKAHYEAEVRSTNEKKKGSHSEKTLCTVTAGGNKLPDMTPDMQLQVLRSARFTFDLMESVLARVEELIEVKLKSTVEEKIGSSKDV
ncbi:glomulin isoform X2 [Ranitomeya variabilis]|uniref:glomulin isoform X2 n=1 Tax=Ranitomeya variabilis TaxID=490064 RepID=UPI004056B3C8